MRYTGFSGFKLNFTANSISAVSARALQTFNRSCSLSFAGMQCHSCSFIRSLIFFITGASGAGFSFQALRPLAFSKIVNHG